MLMLVMLFLMICRLLLLLLALLLLCGAKCYQARWGPKYANTTLFSGGMEFSDGGAVVEDKILNAVLEQGSFLAAFTGNKSFQHGLLCYSCHICILLLRR